MDATVSVYHYTASLPPSERYNLIDQARRCAVSIPSNIAEGCGRNTDKDTARFLSIALGSAYELETQLLLSERLGYASATALLSEVESIQKQLLAFYRKISPKEHLQPVRPPVA